MFLASISLGLPAGESLEHFEQALSQFLNDWLPGVQVGPDAARTLLEAVVGEPNDDSAAFVIHREHLPGSGDLNADLVEGFGADDGDEAVEISWDGRKTEAKTQRIRVMGIPERGRG